MQFKPKNSSCSGFQPHGCRTTPMRERHTLWLWHARYRAIRKGVTFAVCLSGLLALPVFCSAQQEFLNPLYKQQDLTTDRLLPGTWEMKTEDSPFGNWTIVLKFQPGKTGCYDLNFKLEEPDIADRNLHKKTDAMAMKLYACLVKLGQMVFLDVQPKTFPVGATTETFHLAPSDGRNHKNPFSPSVFEIEGRGGDTGPVGLFVTLAPVPRQDSPGAQPEYELRITPAHWIPRIWISESTLRLSDFDPDGDVAMLSTRELQRLVLKDTEESEGFKEAGEFKRKNGGSR